MNTRQETAPTAAEALLRALHAHGVTHVYGNAGTDFPPLIEAYARATADGVPLPEPVTVPHENLAVCMAHGNYLATGKPQVVMVHVNVGTANALCGLLNAARENAPIMLAAGRTPIMEEGPPGSRSVFIHWGQEMFDQGGMVRGAVKWEYELRRADQVDKVVERALSVAMAEPRGPVYLTMPREVLADGPSPVSVQPGGQNLAAAHPDPAAIATAAEWLAASERPILITASLGRRPEEVAALDRLATSEGVGVVAYRPRYMALPSGHPNLLGFDSGPHVKDADLIIVAACDVPWIPKLHAVSPQARVVHLGVDPGFSTYPMRTFRSDLSIAGDVAAALDALREAVARLGKSDRRDSRRRHVETKTQAFRAQVEAARKPGGDGPASNAFVAQCLADIQREDDIVVCETPFPLAFMNFRTPQTFFSTPPAGGLGWGLGASLGLKLGFPERRVIAVVGDGSYMFGNPTPAHFMSAAMDLPTLTVILNNRMWAAVRRATLGMHPDGAASRTNRAALTYLEPSPDYEKVVTASGGYGEKVERASNLPAALARALEAVEKERRAAVLNIITEYSDDEARRDAR